MSTIEEILSSYDDVNEAYEAAIASGIFTHEFSSNSNIVFMKRCPTCGGNGWITTSSGDGSFGTLEQEVCETCRGVGEVESSNPTSMKMLSILMYAKDDIPTIVALAQESCSFVGCRFEKLRFTSRISSDTKLLHKFEDKEDYVLSDGYMLGDRCYANPISDIVDIGFSVYRLDLDGITISLPETLDYTK